MSILIKDMEIPKSCVDCRFCDNDAMCVIWGEDLFDRVQAEVVDHIRYLPDDWKCDDCPLIPVPKHGRLIDADALHKLFEAQWHYLQVLNWDENPTAEAKQTGINWCINTLHDEAPTIIPASGGSET